MQLIIQKSLDIEIWKVVLNLIIIISRLTSSTSVFFSFNDTSIIHSSTSQQGGEQTRRLMKARLFNEIKHCTYWNVERFFRKYFEKESWTSRTSDIYQMIKKKHVTDKWVDFSDSLMQAKILQWWNQFQKKFLFKKRDHFYTTTNSKNLVDAETQR